MNNKEKNSLIIVLSVVVVLLLFGGFGMRSFDSGMMDFSNVIFWLFNGMVSVLLFILIVLGIYWLIKHVNIN